MTVQTGIDNLDRSIHQANGWIGALTDELGDDRQNAYKVLRAFLHLLRDRLTVQETAHLASQLPHLWRGVFYEGWKPDRVPDRHMDRDTFLQRLADEAQLAGKTEASIAAEACARVLRDHIDEGEVRHVLSQLPDKLVHVLSPTT